MKYSELKTGTKFATHSGAGFVVLNEFRTVLKGRKKESEQLVQSLDTGLKLLISNFEKTIIFKHEETKD